MHKKVIVAGLVGAIVLLVWTVVINVFFGFNARFNMKQLPNERAVYSLLKSTVTEPGRYLCNPAPTPEGRFPDRDLSSFGIGGCPLTLAALSAARTVVTWIVVGLAVAAFMRPVRLTDSTKYRDGTA